MKKQIVEQLILEYNSERMVRERFKVQQMKLEEMAHKHGLTKTAFAAGLNESTLLVYLRSKKPCAISEKSIAQAEWVFDNYSE